jgi:triacylglycerol lipase
MKRWQVTNTVALVGSLALILLTACAPTKRFCAVDTHIDFKESLDLARKSELAYLPDSLVRAACAADSCFIITGPVTGARAFVQRNDSTRKQWLAFRGTQTVGDVKLDARYTHHRDTVLEIYLHQGFSNAADELLPLVLPHLRQGYETILTGHSLGGAVAAVMSLHLEAQGYTVRAQTFGQPKVTNIEGARMHASLNLTRFVNGRDPVPLVPPVDWKPGGGRGGSFAHFGREVLLEDGTFECLTTHYIRNLDPAEWEGQAQTEAALDHLLANYLASLEKLQPGK